VALTRVGDSVSLFYDYHVYYIMLQVVFFDIEAFSHSLILPSLVFIEIKLFYQRQRFIIYYIPTIDIKLLR
jgi:hypothetical protein